MARILKKVVLFTCLYVLTYEASAQSPEKRITPATPPRPIKQLQPTIHRDYNWYLADFKRRYPDLAMKLNNSPAIARASRIQANHFSKNRIAAVNATTQALNERLMQRYPQLQQPTGLRMRAAKPGLTYQQVAAAQIERTRKIMEAVQRGDFK